MATASSDEVEQGIDRRLEQAAGELEATRWAAALVDARWRLRWVSEELKALLGEHDEQRLGYGLHLLEAWMSDAWIGKVAPESIEEELRGAVGMTLPDTEGGKRAIAEGLARACGGSPEDYAELLEPLEATPTPPVWSAHFDFVEDGLPPSRVNYVGIRIFDESSEEPLGTVFIFGSGLPASVLAMVARGDEGLFDRMARLVTPGRHAAAILFADLRESGRLSRHLPSAAFFELVRAITGTIDQIVVRRDGIVGKHAGDGVTAFFLAEDLGSRSAAALAAIEAARAIPDAVAGAAETVGSGGLLDGVEPRMSVAVHWGGQLYMGQLVTGGRLEVTALGDTVTECARIQESADSEVLASKALLEHLSEEDAAALGLDPDTVAYRMLAELPGATDKARRDAGTLPVTPL